MTVREAIQLGAGQTLRVYGRTIAANIKRNDDQSIGATVSAGNDAVFGPYPRDYKFTLVGPADYAIDEAPAFEADAITASRTLRQEDIGKLLKVNSSDAVVLTLPATLPEGFVAQVMQLGTGEVSFAAGSGATMVNVDSATTISGRYGVAGVCAYANPDGASASWVIYGALV